MATYFFDSNDPRQNRLAAIQYWENNQYEALTVMSDGAGRYAVGDSLSMGEDLSQYMAPDEWEWMEEDPKDF